MKNLQPSVKGQNLASQRQNINNSEPKINYQLVWKLIFLFISIASAILFNKIYVYQTSKSFQSLKKGNLIELIYGIPFGFFFIFFETYSHKKFDHLCEKYYLSYQRYQTDEARTKRSYALVKWAYSIIYYAFSSIAAFLILKDTSFMPVWLGGSGYCTDVTRYISTFQQANLSMKVFYILQFGKHLGRFFQHVFIKPQGKYYQYALHHGLSTFLILFSYLMNMWIIGIFVLFIHDLSDFTLILGRSYRDYKRYNKIVIKIIYLVGGFNWVFCRVFLLSFCCVYSSLYSAYQFFTFKEKYSTQIYDVLLVPGIFMGFMLFALEILQIFWTYYILKAFVEITVSSKVAKNTYQ